MPRVLEDPDVLEEDTTLSPEYEALHGLPLGMPTSPRGRSHFMVFLRRLITPASRLRKRRQDHCHPGEPRFETALDMLAREYPDVHLRILAGMG